MRHELVYTSLSDIQNATCVEVKKMSNSTEESAGTPMGSVTECQLLGGTFGYVLQGGM